MSTMKDMKITKLQLGSWVEKRGLEIDQTVSTQSLTGNRILGSGSDNVLAQCDVI